MKTRLSLAQVIKVVKMTGAALVIAYCAISMYLIIALAGAEESQDETIRFVVLDNEADACRDRLEQDFLGIIGVLVIRQQSSSVDQITIDRLTASVDRLDRIDQLCPMPQNPGNSGD